MTDEGMMFSATITAADGSTLHRETPNRGELLEWLSVHGQAGTITRIGHEAQTPAAVHRMLIGLTAGHIRMLDNALAAANKHDLRIRTEGGQ